MRGMARPLRIEYAQAVYHVMALGIPWDQNQEPPGWREARFHAKVVSDDEEDDTSSSAQTPLAAPGGVVSSGHALVSVRWT